MRTSELTGALLDYWVARAEGKDGQIVKSTSPCNLDYFELKSGVPYRPSTHWAQGGPLIEKYKIQIDAPRDYKINDKGWVGDIDAGETNHYGEGGTPLQAICRAVVRAAFGDEVPDLTEGGA